MSLLAALGDSASSSLPRHVAIIMDGNGRWAQNRGKMRVSGHKAGVKSVREAVAFAARAKMEALTSSRSPARTGAARKGRSMP